MHFGYKLAQSHTEVRWEPATQNRMACSVQLKLLSSGESRLSKSCSSLHSIGGAHQTLSVASVSLFSIVMTNHRGQLKPNLSAPIVTSYLKNT